MYIMKYDHIHPISTLSNFSQQNKASLVTTEEIILRLVMIMRLSAY